MRNIALFCGLAMVVGCPTDDDTGLECDEEGWCCPNEDANGDGILTLGEYNCTDGSEFCTVDGITPSLKDGVIIEVWPGFDAFGSDLWIPELSGVEIYGIDDAYFHDITLGPRGHVHDLLLKDLFIYGANAKVDRVQVESINVQEPEAKFSNSVITEVIGLDESDVTIVHCTLLGDFWSLHTAHNLSGLHIANNIVEWGLDVDPDGEDTGRTITGTFEGNMYFNVPDGARPNQYDESDAWVVDDPGFVDYEGYGVGTDYHLASGSPALDAGVDLGSLAVINDIDFESRDESPDVGADEKW